MRIPLATYRIQFNPNFTFDHCKQILSYLQQLGISDIYASPIFQARQGSMHGYDVVDPNQINQELGGEESFLELAKEREARDMGWLQDIVPNHMAYDGQNSMLMDVLESGQDSGYYHYFDVNWNHVYENIQGRILAPFLGEFYDVCLERGDIQLHYEESGLSIRYYDLHLPLNINTYSTVFTYNLNKLKRRMRRDPNYMRLLAVLYSLRSIPSKEDLLERRDQISFAKELLWELYQTPDIRQYIDEAISTFNGKPGDSASFDLMDDLLNQQYFHLTFWKVGAEEINYRRFFTINELIAVRMQDKEVFQQHHSLTLKFLEDKHFTGVRIDHIDGILDPVEYLHRLREKSPDAYIVIEKILESHEQLPDEWPIQGTSGYDFLNKLNGLFCLTENGDSFTQIYNKFIGTRHSYTEIVDSKKRLILDTNLSGDVDNLAYAFKQIASRHRYANDLTFSSMRKALVEVLAAFPVYRIYVEDSSLSEYEQAYIHQALELARENAPILLNEFKFIEKVLLLDYADFLSAEERKPWIDFTQRLQQLSSALMAKGVEDTAFYVYNRLLALNEVGGDPGTFGTTLAEFHQYNQHRAATWPSAINATATHDTKRGEDTRARLQVLSELPEEWQHGLEEWHQANSQWKRNRKRSELPNRNDEYFIYQTLLGSYPFYDYEYTQFVDRVKAYVVKAVREAKVHTAWLRPDSEYEEAAEHFVERILERSENNEFLKSFIPFQQKIQHYGIFNSLSQLAIKLTAPGAPDIYQGTELWDLSMVDPDNRRPVDYQQRLHFLTDMNKKLEQDPLHLLTELLSDRRDGRIKLFLMAQTLKQRHLYPELFLEGSYLPLDVLGPKSEHIVAFARQYQKQFFLVVVPRFLTAVIPEDQDPFGEEVWQDTQVQLPPESGSSWQDVLTQQSFKATKQKMLPVAKILQHFPVGLLLQAS
jgi:(1->4)-alpha-D-glucan 1-alpha-D-glucosylmutase